MTLLAMLSGGILACRQWYRHWREREDRKLFIRHVLRSIEHTRRHNWGKDEW